MIRIEEWGIIGNGVCSPEEPRVKVLGITDCGDILTSCVEHVAKDGVILTASGSNYQLGRVNKGYENMYPDALNRFIKFHKKRK